MNAGIEALMARLRAQEPMPPWSTLYGFTMVIVYFVVQVGALAVVSVGLESDAAAAGVVSPLTLNLAAIIGALITLALLWITLQQRVGGSVRGALRLTVRGGSIWLVLLFSLGTAILIDFVPLAFQNIGLPVNLIGLGTAGPGGWIAAVGFVVFIGPLVETLLLQGVLYPAAASRHGNMRAIALTALVYMVLQVALDNPGDPALWLESFLTGYYLTGVRAHQQSTGMALLARIMFGVFAVIKALRLFT